MPLVEFRVRNYRAFADSGPVVVQGPTPIVGRNDVGKSGLLHGLRTFFDPPKRGGLPVSELHMKQPEALAEFEVAFDPHRLATAEVQVDAKNRVHVVGDRLVDASGLLRFRLVLSARGEEAFEILVQDVDADDLFPLAFKGQDELLRLLEAHELPATRAGKETNEEKRRTLRTHAAANGVGLREDWVDAKPAARALREILPGFLLFGDTDDYGIEVTAVQNQFRGIVDKALAATAAASHLEGNIQAAIQSEFDAVYDHLSRLTDSVTSLDAEARVSWRKSVDAIHLNCADASGVSIPYELRGAGVRRLFMVAYFQYHSASGVHDPAGPRYVFAVEEPEVHLHPGAQRELNAAFRDLADVGHSILYTTHSPVFAGTVPLPDLALVVREGSVSTVSQFPRIDASSVAEELGVEASDRLVGRNNVVLVEGRRDVEFYETAVHLLNVARYTSLEPDTVLFLQCGGTGLRFNVTTRCMDTAGLAWGVVADSDRDQPGGPLGKSSQALKACCPESCRLLHFLERSSIENYLDPEVIKSVTGIECLVPMYGRATDLQGAALSNREWDEIKTTGPEVAKAMGAAGLVACSKSATGESELVDLFERIRAAFGL